jgi:hypothetical protein
MNYTELLSILKLIKEDKQDLNQELLGKGLKRRQIRQNAEFLELEDIIAQLNVRRFLALLDREGSEQLFLVIKESFVEDWEKKDEMKAEDWETGDCSDSIEIKYLKGLGYTLESLKVLTHKGYRPILPKPIEELLSLLGDSINVGIEMEGCGGSYNSATKKIEVDWSKGKDSLIIFAHELGHYLYDIWGFREIRGYGLKTWEGIIQEEWDASLIACYILRVTGIPITITKKEILISGFYSYLASWVEENEKYKEEYGNKYGSCPENILNWYKKIDKLKPW